MTDSLPVIRDVDGGTARLLPDVDRPRAWLLTVDDAPQSYVDLDDPAHLEFEYQCRIAHVLDTLAAGARDLVHLGGGALTLPRRMAAVRPGARQRVVEYDRALSDLVLEHLPYGGDASGIMVHGADARQWLAEAPEESADAVVGDVFGGSRVPAELTTLGCAREVARLLRPGGVFAANLADGAPFAFLRSQLATFGAVFAHLALVAEPGVLRGRRFGNAVLVASGRPLDTAELARRTAADPFPARVVEGNELRRFTGSARPVGEGEGVGSPVPPGGAFRVGGV
ncbi:spermidine synthase [Streptomyces albidoflavus]|uniref:spermidine synthase n=1 Tax=Streptomyces albidoflavus TaxID=1886 RepID=UPI00340EA044